MAEDCRAPYTMNFFAKKQCDTPFTINTCSTSPFFSKGNKSRLHHDRDSFITLSIRVFLRCVISPFHINYYFPLTLLFSRLTCCLISSISCWFLLIVSCALVSSACSPPLILSLSLSLDSSCCCSPAFSYVYKWKIFL